MIEQLRARRALQAPAAALILAASLHAGSGTAPGAATVQPAPRWMPATTGVTARLRGVSAVSDRVVWASGSNGTVIRTQDGGASWTTLTVPDAQKLDFRDIDAVDDRTAYVLSIGAGDASRIYKTSDAGATWRLQFRNEDPKAFFDAMAFRNARTGYALSDSVDGQLIVIRTTDGTTWTRIASGLPPALDGEGAYAASGTNVAILDRQIWLATTASRVIRSDDDGRSWKAVSTPLPTGTSAGIFSIAFRDRGHGLIVGGDYKKEAEAADNAAISTDGGASWTLVKGLSGFRSAVAFVPARRDTVVAVGPSGSDIVGRWRPDVAPDRRPGFSHAERRAPIAHGVGGWGKGASGED